MENDKPENKETNENKPENDNNNKEINNLNINK